MSAERIPWRELRKRLDSVVDGKVDPVAVLQAHNMLFDARRAARKLWTGYQRGEVLSKNEYDVLMNWFDDVEAQP